MWMIHSFFKILLDVVFPPCCYICKKNGSPLCSLCINTFEKPLHKQYDWVYSLYSYRDSNVKKIIHAIKFFRRRDLVTESLFEHKLITQDLFTEEKVWTLIPIPTPTARKYSRGYNQSELLAYALSAKTGMVVMKDILLKSKYTTQQVSSSSKQERLQKQKNSFVCTTTPPDYVMLVDDVVTTGATLQEARSVLIRHGAKKVIAITLAH